MPASPAVLDASKARVAEGKLAPDPAQEAVAQRLAQLSEALSRWNPDAWLGKGAQPRGLYLWGPVGRGKKTILFRV